MPVRRRRARPAINYRLGGGGRRQARNATPDGGFRASSPVPPVTSPRLRHALLDKREEGFGSATGEGLGEQAPACWAAEGGARLWR